MRRSSAVLSVAAVMLLAGCGASEGDPAVAGGQDDTGLPAACVLPPTSVEAARTGSSPAGGDAFEVADAVALPTPIVPNPDGALSREEMSARAASTDLFGYSLIFSNEPIADGSIEVDLFDDVPEGETLGTVTIFPAASEPLAAGDVVTDGATKGLSVPLPRIGADLRISTDDTNSYLDSPAGQVEVLALTADNLCLDVDLTWELNDPEGNVLTINGVLTGRLLSPSRFVTLG